MMTAGRMRNRASFQTPPVNQDSAGGRAGPWNTVITLWARVRPLRGSRYFEAAKYTHEVDTEITIRFNSQVKEDHRIVLDDGRIFKITSIIRVENIKKEMTIMAKEMPDGEPA